MTIGGALEEAIGCVEVLGWAVGALLGGAGEPNREEKKPLISSANEPCSSNIGIVSNGTQMGQTLNCIIPPGFGPYSEQLAKQFRVRMQL